MGNNTKVGDRHWVSADGKKTLVSDLPLGHLVNILNWMDSYTVAYPKVLRVELSNYAKEQALLLFSQGKEYPFDNGTKWVIVNPETGDQKISPPPQSYYDNIKDVNILDRVTGTNYSDIGR